MNLMQNKILNEIFNLYTNPIKNNNNESDNNEPFPR